VAELFILPVLVVRLEHSLADLETNFYHIFCLITQNIFSLKLV